MVFLLLLAFLVNGVGADCVLAGDPFYTTFDGATLEFQGKCNYNLASFDDPNGAGLLTKFNVFAQNAPASHDSTRSYTQRTHVDVLNHRISLHDNGKVYVDEIDKTNYALAAGSTGFNIGTGGAIKVLKESNVVTVIIDNIMTVTWDARGPSGRHIAKIKLTNSGYAGQVTGLCGNHNGNEADDHYPYDQSTPGTDTEVGNSWIANGQDCL